jgi:methylmalonyl-CoA mutase
MMATKDPETNILRNTIAAFSAAAGGADSIAVLPHSIAHGLPDGFARRIARNTQLILARESRIDVVADPASGSGSVETLTDALCEAAWDEFRRIEAEGGVLDSLVAGRIQSRIVEARGRLGQSYREGRRQIVGTTLYPVRSERSVATLAAERRPVRDEGALFCERLEAMRIDQLIGPSP